MKWIVILFGLSAWISCGQANQEKVGDSVIFLFDITDTFEFIQEVNSGKLKPHFGINGDLNSGAKCRVATIENLRYTRQVEFSVASTGQWEANVLDRMAQWDSFLNKLDRNIRNIKDQAIGRNGSYVAYAIYRALKQLTLDTTFRERKLFVFSDMREHTPGLSFYKESTLRQLKENPEVLFEYLDSQYPLPDLKGVDLIMVFRSKNEREDDAYFILSSFWKAYYERKSAIVTIHSELPD